MISSRMLIDDERSTGNTQFLTLQTDGNESAEAGFFSATKELAEPESLGQNWDQAIVLP